MSSFLFESPALYTITRGACALLMCALVLPACASPEVPECAIPSGLPVFPGAAGFGTTTPAGRGGKVLEVTSLDDDGPGTLRDAVEMSGPRIIVFRIGGTITLKNHLEIHEPFLTIAGQTAPGDGILINGAGLVIFTHDVLVQHLRIRPGAFSDVEPDLNDSIAILGSEAGTNDDAFNIVIDHVSASWGEDENVSTLFHAHDLTISWSIISEALDKARHDKGGHSAGLLLGDYTNCATVHHTLMAHNAFRNPLLSGGGRHDIENNVMYNWRDIATELAAQDRILQTNLVANCYLPGPSSNREIRETIYHTGDVGRYVTDSSELLSPAGRPELFVQGNQSPHRPNDSVNEWAIVSNGWDGTIAPETFRIMNRFPAPVVPLFTAADACNLVLDDAGASKPRRDSVDTRVIDEVRTGKGRIIDKPEDVGGFPTMNTADPPADIDHDGMPDAWELQEGLDPNDPSDAALDADADGYTNIEHYLHSLLGLP
jgi:pectate lyase